MKAQLEMLWHASTVKRNRQYQKLDQKPKPDKNQKMKIR